MKAFAPAACVVMLVILCSSLPVMSQELVYVGDERFQSVNGEWFLLDDADRQWKVVPGVIVVRFDSSIDSTLAPSALADLSLTLLWPSADIGGYYRFSFDSNSSPPAILEATLDAPHVTGAYLDTELQFFGDPDPYFDEQWNLLKARVDKAWEVVQGASDLTIAILDGGFQIDHEDLVETLWTNEAEASGQPNFDDDGNGYVDDIHGWDFVPTPGHPNGDNDVSPAVSSDRHGTPVAGIACATMDNGKGIAGAAGGHAGDRPKLLMLKIYTVSNVAPAIEYARRAGADIVNWSGGGYGDAGGAGSVAIHNAYAAGVLFFGAMGNSNTPVTVFPATHPDVIGVGSTDQNDARVCTSTYGPYLDIMGPSSSVSCSSGPYIWTTDGYGVAYDYNPGDAPCGSACGAIPPDNNRYFGKFIGTSAACPLVAAVGGLIKSHFLSLTNDQVRDRLLGSTVDLGSTGRDDQFGYGRVDAYRALTEWGTITGNVTWSPSDTRAGVRYISGDLTIAPGATLTIMPGTTVRLASTDDLGAGSDLTLVEIIVKGTLIADGTAVDPIVFERWGTSGNWAGINFDASSGGGTLDYCMISDAETAVESYAPLIVKNSVISNCENAGVVSLAGGALVHNCQLNSPGHIGIDLQSDEAVVRNSLVDGAVDYAVRVFANTVTTLKLRSSEFNNSGIGLFVNGNATVGVDSSCYFYHNDTGIHLYDCGATVNIFRSGITWNPSGGIVCDGSSAPLIEENTLAHNGGGIYCSNASSPRIQWNQIQSAGNAVTVTSDAAPDLGHTSPSGNQSTGNNKISNAAKYVVNSTSSAIYAQHNCWGVNSGGCNPATSKFTGTVDRSNPICCSFPPFSHGEGEPTPSEGFMFQSDPVSPEGRARATTGLVAIVPNPFNPNTTIHYTLASSATVQISVYDVAGRLVQTLVDETEVGGQHTAEWKGMDRTGASVASGIYFVRMVTAGQTFTRKMVLLK